MMKKIIIVILAVVMCMGMTGCSLFETFSNKEEDTVTSYSDVNSLKNNKAYIWHNDRESDIQKDLENPADYDVFFQCIKGDINFKGEENAYSARTAHPFRRNGAPFRFKLSKAQQVD